MRVYEAYFINVLIAVMGCTSQRYNLSENQTSGFYFSTSSGGVYQYDGTISKVSGLNVNSIESLQEESVFATTQTALSFIGINNDKKQFIEIDDRIVVSAISNDQMKTFYVNQEGQLKIYHNQTQLVEDLGVNCFTENSLFFRAISEINLS